MSELPLEALSKPTGALLTAINLLSALNDYEDLRGHLCHIVSHFDFVRLLPCILCYLKLHFADWAPLSALRGSNTAQNDFRLMLQPVFFVLSSEMWHKLDAIHKHPAWPLARQEVVDIIEGYRPNELYSSDKATNAEARFTDTVLLSGSSLHYQNPIRSRPTSALTVKSPHSATSRRRFQRTHVANAGGKNDVNPVGVSNLLSPSPNAHCQTRTISRITLKIRCRHCNKVCRRPGDYRNHLLISHRVIYGALDDDTIDRLVDQHVLSSGALMTPSPDQASHIQPPTPIPFSQESQSEPSHFNGSDHMSQSSTPARVPANESSPGFPKAYSHMIDYPTFSDSAHMSPFSNFMDGTSVQSGPFDPKSNISPPTLDIPIDLTNDINWVGLEPIPSFHGHAMSRSLDIPPSFLPQEVSGQNSNLGSDLAVAQIPSNKKTIKKYRRFTQIET